MTDDEQELDDYLCSAEHQKYFDQKLRRGLRIPKGYITDYTKHKEDDNERIQ